MSNCLFITHAGLTIWTEYFGCKSMVPVLLLAGAGQSGLYWPDRLCNKLADAGFFVIRFDYRDVGASSRVNYDENPYTLEDLAKDAVGLLNAYNINKAHIIGISMGGYIAQIISARYPERAYSLTSISSSPDHRPAMDVIHGRSSAIYKLPAPSPLVAALWQQSSVMANASVQERLEYFLAVMRLYNDELSFNRAEIITLKKRIDAHTKIVSNGTLHHRKATDASPERTTLLKQIRVRTLIIHGDKDMIFPIEHAIETKRLISGAQLQVISGMGHLINNYWADSICSLVIPFLHKDIC